MPLFNKKPKITLKAGDRVEFEIDGVRGEGTVQWVGNPRAEMTQGAWQFADVARDDGKTLGSRSYRIWTPTYMGRRGWS